LRPEGTPARVAFERALQSAPGWVRPAMALRNALVAPFGLIRGEGEASGSGPDFLARLPVVHDRPDLFETGVTDQHLTFVIRIEAERATVAARTLIWFHAGLGRAYLMAVLPAHKLLMRHMVAQLGRP